MIGWLLSRDSSAALIAASPDLGVLGPVGGPHVAPIRSPFRRVVFCGIRDHPILEDEGVEISLWFDYAPAPECWGAEGTLSSLQQAGNLPSHFVASYMRSPPICACE